MSKIIKIKSKHGIFKVIVDNSDYNRIKDFTLWIGYSRINKKTHKNYLRVQFNKGYKKIKLHRYILKEKLEL